VGVVVVGAVLLAFGIARVDVIVDADALNADPARTMAPNARERNNFLVMIY